MEITKQTWWVIGGFGTALAGVGTYYLFIKKKPESDKYGNLKVKNKKSGGIKGGVQTTKTGTGSTVVEPNWTNPYDKEYMDQVLAWVKPRKVYRLTKESAKRFAKEIKEAKGWLYDDNDKVKAVFDKLKDKGHVSTISKAFLKEYKTDMYDYLLSFLSESEMDKYVHKPVNRLENYRYVK